MSARRIQRSRAKGWRAPFEAVYVGRPTIWGNPFNTHTLGSTRAAMDFKAWLAGEIYRGDLQKQRTEILRRLPELKGKTLMCWCNEGDACHADILLGLANPEAFHP